MLSLYFLAALPAPVCFLVALQLRHNLPAFHIPALFDGACAALSASSAMADVGMDSWRKKEIKQGGAGCHLPAQAP